MRKLMVGSVVLCLVFITGCKRVEEVSFSGSYEEGKPAGDFVQMKVKEVVADREGNPVVVLQDMAERQNLYIWIGFAEARAIHMELSHQKPPRPMTHDLIRNIFSTLGIKVIRVEVTDLKDNIFYARIYLQEGDRKYSVDSRPSDAIAISLRTGAPIYVAKDVLNRSGVATDVKGESGILYIGALGIYLQEVRGKELKEVFGVEGGLIVTQIEEGKAGENMGLQRGDVVVEVNGKKVSVIEDILSIMEEGEITEVKVIREGEEVVLKR